jgi:hypothetical protein
MMSWHVPYDLSMIITMTLVIHEGKICHIIEVEHRVLEENSWVLTRIYPAILSPNFGKIVNNSANLEDDDE